MKQSNKMSGWGVVFLGKSSVASPGGGSERRLSQKRSKAGLMLLRMLLLLALTPLSPEAKASQAPTGLAGIQSFLSLLSTPSSPRPPSQAQGALEAQERCYNNDPMWKPHTWYEGTVLYAKDGDSLAVQIDGRKWGVRLLNIDTPEKKYRGKTQGYWAQEATDYMVFLAKEGSKVHIKTDEVPCGPYWRILGHAYVDDVHLNREMVEAGLAVNYCISPNFGHCEEFARIVKRNLDSGKAFYGSSDFEWPYLWRRAVRNSDMTAFIGDIYTHRVYRPAWLDDVRGDKRVFFFKKREIQNPWYLVESE